MTLGQVLLVARKELRETLRDRRTLAVMVLFPLVVYPLVSLATVQVLTARIGRTEKQPARVAVAGPPALAAKLRARLAARNHDGNEEFAFPPGPATAAEVRAGRADAAIVVGPPTGGQVGPPTGGQVGPSTGGQVGPPAGGQVGPPAEAAAGAPSARVFYDETQERSRTARDRIEQALAAGAEPACAAPYAITVEGVAPRTALGGYMLSKILPLVIVVMVMLGAFHPAIDITAGERERGTLETTLSAPIPRAALMTGKVVAVATLSTLSGVLNLASMSLTVLEGAKLAAAGATLAVPWANAGAAALLVIPPAAFLFASVMVAIGALARSFKEAQTLLTPVYVLCMAPSLLAALGDFELRGAVAFVPGIGVTLLARDVIAGHASVGGIVAVFASSVGYGAAALALACRLYDSERLLGADDAGLGLRAWLRHLLLGPGARAGAAAGAAEAPPTAGQAIALFGVAVLVLLASAPLQKWRVSLGLLLFEWVGLLGLTVVYARGSGRRLSAVLRLRAPSASAAVGAIVIGAAASLVLNLLMQWVMPPPKQLEEEMRRVLPSGEGPGVLAFALLLLAATPAVCEEALFRGPILRGLRTRFSPLGASVLTGLLFGIYHASIWRFLPTALLGFGLSAIALAADSIVPAMLAHFTYNACIVTLSRVGVDSGDSGPVDPRQRLALIAVGTVLLAAGAALVARGRRARPVDHGPHA